MSQEALEKVKSRVAALGKGTPIPGKGGDRRFRIDGQNWRVQVRPFEQISGEPLSDGTEPAPKTTSLIVRVSLLDEDGKVQSDSITGAPLVFEPETLTVQDLTREDFDPELEIMMVVENRIREAQRSLENKNKLSTAINSWTDENIHDKE